MEYGVRVATNIDEFSPDWLIHGETFIDINRIHTTPLTRENIRRIGKNGQFKYRSNISWERVLSDVCGHSQ